MSCHFYRKYWVSLLSNIIIINYKLKQAPMRKLIVFLFVSLVLNTSFMPAPDAAKTMSADARMESHITGIYRQIDFSRNDRLPYEVFSKAYHGYLNLRQAGKLNVNNEILTICDFDLPSTQNRMWILDLAKKTVLFNNLVAHGQGTGEDCAEAFSNKPNSHQSSLGFYVTGETYDGEHGLSLRLVGMDEGFNDAAFDRDIVVHGAPYVCAKYISENDRLGRSWGCPAVPEKLSAPIINAIKDSTCLFIYYPDHKYLAASQWLNKKPGNLPESDMMAGLITTQQAMKPTPKVRIIQYVDKNGHIDSVKTIPY